MGEDTLKLGFANFVQNMFKKELSGFHNILECRNWGWFLVYETSWFDWVWWTNLLTGLIYHISYDCFENLEVKAFSRGMRNVNIWHPKKI